MAHHLKHPFRLLVTGYSRSGKTTAVVELVDRYYSRNLDQVIIVSPTYHQNTWDPIRDLVDENYDVYEEASLELFDSIERNIKEDISKGYVREDGIPIKRRMLIVDDSADSYSVHMGGKGSFNRLVYSAAHYNLSIIMISQRINMISTGLRTNLEGYITFAISNQIELNAFKNSFDFMRNKDKLIDVLDIATRKPRGYLYLQMHPKLKAYNRYGKEIKVSK